MVAYVDDSRRPGDGSRQWWSHLFADSRSELDRLPRRLRIPVEWHRDVASGVHCELTEPMRLYALRLGAVEIRQGSREWRVVVRRSRRLAVGVSAAGYGKGA